MGSIVTFYSYKGGVGRSMALANIAVLLAQHGRRVLAIDWDLEAPGLERYFNTFPIVPHGAGLLPLLSEVSKGRSAPHVDDYSWRIGLGRKASITFLPSGREIDPAGYARQLENFDWNGFFQHGGGDFLEEMRRKWKKDFDLVLIDSRTGLSDTGGVCTILLPDAVVLMFTANDQSLLGARDVMRYVREARQYLAYPRMELTVFPVPARVSPTTEFRETQKWFDRFGEELKEFYDDWLPSWAQPREVLQKVKIPQVDFFSYGEKLPVVEQGVSDPNGMGYAYDLIAHVLEHDFLKAHEILGLRERRSEEQILAHRSASADDYEYDLYVSQSSSSYMDTRLEEFLADLTRELSHRIGREPMIFRDRKEVLLDAPWPEQVKRALLRSRLLLSVITPAYYNSKWTLAEWATFVARAALSLEGSASHDMPKLVFPVIFDGTRVFYAPELSHHRPAEMLYSYYLEKGAMQSTAELAEDITKALRDVPSFRPDFPLVEQADVISTASGTSVTLRTITRQRGKRNGGS